MRKKVIFSIYTLLIGVLIYYLYQKQILVKNNIIASFIRNYIPDILWTISFYSVSTIFLKEITKNYIIYTAIHIIIIGIFFELLQFTGVVIGTFDFFDIIIYIISAIVASLIENKYWRKKT